MIMYRELAAAAVRPPAPAPSLEALVHALLPPRYIDHTHADAVLALTNQAGGEQLAREALGPELAVMPYVEPGFPLALAAAAAFRSHPSCRGMVWMRHGIVTWGETARESYENMIAFVTRAERWIEKRILHVSSGRERPRGADAAAGRGRGRRPAPAIRPPREQVRRAGGISCRTRRPARRFLEVAPILRGLLATPSGDPDRPLRNVVLAPLTDAVTRGYLQSPGAKSLALSAPLTSDHVIRTRALPLWVDEPAWGDAPRLRGQLARAVGDYAAAYEAGLDRHAAAMPQGSERGDPNPRVVLLPGLGAVCAGPGLEAARIARDIAAHTLRVKSQIAAMGTYEGLGEEALVSMEYRAPQQAKLRRGPARALEGSIALVTGAAGAIGSGICEELLEQGCLVAAADLPGERLEGLVAELGGAVPREDHRVRLRRDGRGLGRRGVRAGRRRMGGLDLLVVNAGLAHVSPIAGMELGAFRRLEAVNVEGTLLALREAARLLERQGTGGDIVLVSSKNVFSPGAGFGAYSATKAASHQLARIASLELAPLGVRVNMVSPDAVFGEGSRRSGLWEQVGPDRMKARGLDEKGLEEYYRGRNLLKARITARHVARAVLFFATRQAPITGATLPVDGGLPDATPR